MENAAQHKVSIIMPTYNRANYIGETIESVQKQTYPNWELIIIDDGSDDNTEQIISNIHDERIQFYKAGRIGINGKVKNIGLTKASGELIAFIDSDDLWAETKLEKQVIALGNYPGGGFSLTGGYNFRKLQQPIDFFYKQRNGIRYGEIFIPFFRSEISTTTPSLIFRKECLNTVNGFDEAKPFSDIDFILKLASQFKAVILYEPLLFRRLHDANDSGANWIKGYEQGITMIKNYRDQLPPKIVREAFFKLYINFGEDCLTRNKKTMATKNFFVAWKNKPFSIVPLKKTAKVFLNPLLFKNGSDNENENGIAAKPWKNERPPKRILAIRLQAMGDVTITLPYLQHLRRSLPVSVKMDLLTRKECDDIAKNIVLFDKVISIGGGRNFKKQLLQAIFHLPRLLSGRYDVIIDLQNNELSEFIRKAIRPKAWSAFDRFSTKAAGERTSLTIEAIGLGKNEIDPNFQFKKDNGAVSILEKNGWEGKNELVVLNPAGAFTSRSWPLENYVSFAGLWLKKFPSTQFLIVGTSFISSKAEHLKNKLGDKLISVVDQTTPSQAFAILQQTKFVLSEDSGLMHMSWVSGIPTLVLFGSTRSDWSRPLGPNSFYLDSSDLPCGNCMQEVCLYNDVHCLTRYTPERIFAHAQQILMK
jgi:ADP-heptose:LPS heptosyltransferase